LPKTIDLTVISASERQT